MAERPLAKFIELVQFDQKLQATHTEIENLSITMHTLNLKKQEISEQFEQTKDQSYTAHKKVDLLELQAKELEETLSEKKRKLERVNSQKEYQSLQTEINKLQQEQNHFEVQLMNAWEVLESANKQYQESQKQIEIKMQELEKQEQETQKKIQDLQAYIIQQTIEREQLEQQVPEQWRESYEVMRTRVADPVVSVEGQLCSACSYRMIDNDFQSLRLGKLLQCRKCYRFLYLPS